MKISEEIKIRQVFFVPPFFCWRRQNRSHVFFLRSSTRTKKFENGQTMFSWSRLQSSLFMALSLDKTSLTCFSNTAMLYCTSAYFWSIYMTATTAMTTATTMAMTTPTTLLSFTMTTEAISYHAWVASYALYIDTWKDCCIFSRSNRTNFNRQNSESK